MQIRVIPFGTLRVDSHTMFSGLSGARLRSYYTPDGNGMLKIAMNALLVEASDRLVLIDPGCADFFPAKLANEYGLELRGPLDHVLDETGYCNEDITDVVFTHLHFDHGSGAFRRVRGTIEKRYPKAAYHVQKAHYDYALSPDPREEDSLFVKLLKYAGPLSWLEDWNADWMSFHRFDGHTHAMQLPVIHTPGADTYFLTDLVPMRPFFEADVTSLYDLDAGQVIEEKGSFLKTIKKGSVCILFHEPHEYRVFYP
ncbi:MAG: hypothetical protein CSA96_10465 [Bacteroidetes bacterium]|nr:MAG: hypothetical protein CSA96_10465 [Bacteroidota bacterium]